MYKKPNKKLWIYQYLELVALNANPCSRIRTSQRNNHDQNNGMKEQKEQENILHNATLTDWHHLEAHLREW